MSKRLEFVVVESMPAGLDPRSGKHVNHHLELATNPPTLHGTMNLGCIQYPELVDVAVGSKVTVIIEDPAPAPASSPKKK